ncbi:Zn-dependent exopeptidase [Hesseltinella vesiculosa]|uniref:Zn-dependent exopeptidase n=1 Tax=Hesseltinella vesiculosa TaxID=101127 RepID=A0A1X2GX54_9FUNG|nr:Zn-dependent exopeptidase [Hesseltinella vesiculosa]
MLLALPRVQLISSQGSDALATQASQHDSVIVFFTDKAKLVDLVPSLQAYAAADKAFGSSIQVVCPLDQKPHSRLLLVPTGTLTDDVDDPRRFKDAAFEGGKRALAAGMVNPLVCFADAPEATVDLKWTMEDDFDYKHYLEVTMLGLLEASYEPIDVVEHAQRSNKPVQVFDALTFATDLAQAQCTQLIQKVQAIENGRRVTKDIGNPDPERMSPIRIVDYLQTVFKDQTNIKLTIIDDLDVIQKEYPLAHAVCRASLKVPRHHPRFVLFEYKSPDQSSVKENLYFVGKGVTYDTGGADIKAGGVMRGMSRDKCGAAAVAGFFKTIGELAPKNVNAIGGLALVRNSIGSDAYVSDEVIYARSGKRVLVGNTDAEGRMVMTDLLCQFKEMAVAHSASGEPAGKQPALLFTVATLTGHALKAYGGYGITMDNGVARRHRVSRRIYDAGHVLADPFEISTLRREDVEVVQPGRSSEDIVQANDKASSATCRGHQYPAGFMLLASGLDQHGLYSSTPIGYTHLDIAGSAETMSAVGWSLTRVTASPLPALTYAFL